MDAHAMTKDMHIPDVRKDLRFRVKDPGSAGTHFIGFIAAILMTPVLLVHASGEGADFLAMLGLSVFMVSMILLYGASSAYHTFDISEKANLVLKKIDHMMIFVLIAGSYTPICLTAIRGTTGTRLMMIVWGLALAGIILKGFWVTCPKWFSSVIYIGMGWTCVLAMPQLIANLSMGAFLWLLLGGILYTVGGVIYAMKFPVFHNRFQYFGCHELFHVFVVAGSLCHYIVMYNYLPLAG